MLELKHSKWLKSYIGKQKKQQNCEKDFFIEEQQYFGKTIENVGKSKMLNLLAMKTHLQNKHQNKHFIKDVILI